MKVAVSASGTNLDARVDPRFGRCPYYLFVDMETGEYEALHNAATMAGRGAGIQAAEFVVQKGCDAVISGNMGPNAYRVFSAAGIPIYTAPGMNVGEAVEALKAGHLNTAQGATASAHSGMGARRGMGRAAAPPPPPPSSPPGEIESLKQEITELQEKVGELVGKIEELSEEESAD